MENVLLLESHCLSFRNLSSNRSIFHIEVFPLQHNAMNHIHVLFFFYSFKSSFYFTFVINYYLYTKNIWKYINLRQTAPDRERIHKKIKIPISSFSPSPRICSNVLLFNEIHSYDDGTRLLRTTRVFCFLHTEKQHSERENQNGWLCISAVLVHDDRFGKSSSSQAWWKARGKKHDLILINCQFSNVTDLWRNVSWLLLTNQLSPDIINIKAATFHEEDSFNFVYF